MSQSCDIRPESSILYAELRERKEEPFSSDVKVREKQIIKILHDETRIHYFPPSESIEILKAPKIMDFKSLFLIPYELLHKNLGIYFVARLKITAKQVLCDKISKFFTRLAFEDIIFLRNEEIKVYAKKRGLSLDEINEILTNFKRYIEYEEKD